MDATTTRRTHMKLLPKSHDSWPYRITDALIAIAFVGVVSALWLGVL